jgi:hypothetical protein
LIDTLITSKTRIKLLMKFFLNPDTSAHLRGLEEEFKESTNGIRVELNRLEEAGMLTSDQVGQKKLFRVCTTHPLYGDIHNIVKKYLGLDKLVERVVEGLGGLERVYLTGSLANGHETGTIDVILVGDLNQEYLVQVINRAETLLSKKINYLLYPGIPEMEGLLSGQPHLLLWQREL